jgi:PAS domain S-box-containing protein
MSRKKTPDRPDTPADSAGVPNESYAGLQRIAATLIGKDEQYRIFTEGAFEALFLSEQGICIGQNPAAKRMFGYSDEEALGRSGTEWIAPEYRDRVQENMLSGYTKPYEAVALRKDGTTFPCELQGRMTDFDGRRIRITALRDITDRKLAEQAVQASEERYRGVFDNAAVGIDLVDANGRFLQVNRALAAMLGYSEEELLTLSVFDITHPDDIDVSRSRLQQMMNRVVPGYRLEKRFIKKDGSVLWAEISVSAVRGPDENYVATIGVITDITQRKEAEESLRQYQILLETVNQSQTDFMLQTDRHEVFEGILRNLLLITESQYGFIGEVFTADDGVMYQQSRAISNITWNDETRRYYEKNWRDGLLFKSGNTLTGSIMTTGRPVISNDPVNDPRYAGTPDGHPPIHSFLGLPIYVGERLVGTMGMANRPRGYDDEIVELLKPYCTTCGGILHAHRLDEDRKKALADLRESEEKYSTLFRQAPDSVMLVDAETGEITEFNDSAHTNLGYTREEFRHLKIADFEALETPEEIDRRIRQIGKAGRDSFETLHRTKDGAIRNVFVRTAAITLRGRRLIQCVWRDVTDRKRTEADLRKSEALLKATGRIAKVGGWEYDVETGRVEWTDEVYNIYGVTRDRHDPIDIAKDLSYYDPRDRDLIMEAFDNARTKGQSYEIEARFLPAEGSSGWVRTTGRAELKHGKPVRVMGHIMDITERKEAEIALKRSLNEKEVLLREIHHRVKNNLAIVSSLLNLQSGAVADERLEREFDEVRRRIRSIALAHELLYQSSDLSNINTEEYVSSLVDHLVAGGHHIGSHITLRKAVENVSLKMDSAIPLGLILTELVSNCLKHAFSDGRDGDIQISLRSPEVDSYELIVKDTGVGLPPGLVWEKSSSLGLVLVNTFVEQLGGSIELIQEGGTEVRIRFGSSYQNREP